MNDRNTLVKNVLQSQWDGTERVESLPSTLDIISRRFNKPDRFLYVRYGDAEYKVLKDCIGLKRRADSFNRNQVKFGFPERERFSFFEKDLKKELRALSLVKDDCVEIASWKGRPLAGKFKQLNFYVCNSFLYPKLFHEFASSALRDKKVLFVGAEHIANNELANKALSISNSIIIDGGNSIIQESYYHMLDAYDEILEAAPQYDIVLAAMGLGTKSLAYKLYAADVNVRFMDIGSLGDAFAQKVSRRWISRLIRGDVHDYETLINEHVDRLGLNPTKFSPWYYNAHGRIH